MIKILNSKDCGYTKIYNVGKNLWGRKKNSNKIIKLHIQKILIIKDSSVTNESMFSSWRTYDLKVDLDIFLLDGNVIQIFTNRETFILNILRYVPSLNTNVRESFYGTTEENEKKRQYLQKMIQCTQELIKTEEALIDITEQEYYLSCNLYGKTNKQSLLLYKKIICSRTKVSNLIKKHDSLTQQYDTLIAPF